MENEWQILPTWSWEEHKENVERNGNNIENVQQANFECWMRERYALNQAMLTIQAIKTYVSVAPRMIDGVIKQCELNPDKFSHKTMMEEMKLALTGGI